MRDLHPAPARQVPVVVELLLELQDLLTGVGRPRALRLTPCVVWTHCGRTTGINDHHNINVANIAITTKSPANKHNNNNDNNNNNNNNEKYNVIREK